MSTLDPVISLVNDRALLISFSHHVDIPHIQRRVLRLAQDLRKHSLCSASNPDGPLRDIVPGPGNLMLELTPDASMPLTELTERLESCWKRLEDRPSLPPRTVEIPVCYGGEHGPDLMQVARHTGLTPQSVIERHAANTYEVLCLGFQPGFPYLHGLDPALNTPRRDTPRSRIPAGSVAIGADRTGIYPSPSPGGWLIIGHTELKLFDADNPERPTLLLPGDRVRFTIAEAIHV
ncbi:MAG: 5-oxoprolinase subunit PxpB [Pseudohongiellaceae bacterium]